MPSSKKSIFIGVGKRKTAIAKATVKQGKGRVRINNFPVETLLPEVSRRKIMEPLLLCKEVCKDIDIDVTVKGGGFMGQAEASRMAIAHAIVRWSRSSKTKKKLLNYDESMIKGDPRRKEPKKWGGPGARRKKQKSYR
jgi:small subunit ribosomal protein S9